MQRQSTSPMADGASYYDLGSYHRLVTTSSADSQLWFNRGLIWAYSFNHAEAERCFERAATNDPNFLGLFRLSGTPYFHQKVNDILAQASKLATQATPVEQALVKAIGSRFPPLGEIPDDLSPYNHAYADAMRSVYQKFSNDVDVAALFAEALMCITPRGLWNLDTGKPTGEHTIEARKVIEQQLETTGRDHPAICHLHIHTMEMSPSPKLALPAADRLRGMVPHTSHMLHICPKGAACTVFRGQKACDQPCYGGSPCGYLCCDSGYTCSGTGTDGVCVDRTIEPFPTRPPDLTFTIPELPAIPSPDPLTFETFDKLTLPGWTFSWSGEDPSITSEQTTGLVPTSSGIANEETSSTRSTSQQPTSSSTPSRSSSTEQSQGPSASSPSSTSEFTGSSSRATTEQGSLIFWALSLLLGVAL